jgi:transposase
MLACCGALMTGPTFEIPSVPRETLRAARAVFSRKNFYILVGEQLGAMLEDIEKEKLSVLCESSRPDGEILPLITFFQFVEGLTDLQAMDALRTRIEWKFALHLPVNTLPFHQQSLCEFRQRIISDKASQHEFQKLVDRLIALNPPSQRPEQNFEALALVSSLCSLNLMDRALDAIGAALGMLAGKYPEWLLQVSRPHWYWQYNHLTPSAYPATAIRQQEISLERLGADIQHLLEEVQRSTLDGIEEIQEIKSLHCLWEQHFKNGGLALSQYVGVAALHHCDSCRLYAG